MRISQKDWNNYVSKLRKLSDTAADKLKEYISVNGFEDTESLIEYTYALVTKYGEGSAELACQMYDEVAEMSGAAVDSAVPAATATYDETARAVYGSLIQSPAGRKLTHIADRLVKQAAADTTIQNAVRDGAEWAWVPSGDTCGFCITLASRGWQKASKTVLKGNHATHIHAHCDCQFAIRFNGKDTVSGYDAEKYKKLYDAAPGSSSDEKVKNLRKMLEDRDAINAQKRESYHKLKTVETREKLKELSKIYDINPGNGNLSLKENLSKDDQNDNTLARWIHKNIGGDIKCLPETSDIGKNVDAIWNGDFWEFKSPTTKNAIDDRLRKANKQIIEAQNRNNTIGNVSGVLIDISNCTISEDEAVNTIIDKAQKRLQNNTYIIVKNKNDIVTDYLVKK